MLTIKLKLNNEFVFNFFFFTNKKNK